MITQDLKHLWRLARIYTQGTSLSMPIPMLWLELQLFLLHLNFTLIYTYPCEFSSQSHDFSDPKLKNLSDQQSIRLTFRSILYISGTSLCQSTRIQSLDSTLSPSVQQQLHHRLPSWWTLQDKGPTKHLKITVPYEEKGKSHARPSAFVETFSATPAGCSNTNVGSPAAAFLKALAGLIPQGARAGPQAVAPKPDREVNAMLDWLSRLSGES